ncbi:MAG: PD-(D/E)XK nuclease family protein [Acidobacteriota bacterium]
MALPEDFIFSQSSLQDFQECPRRFELRYLLDVRWPAIESEPALEFEVQTLQGQTFHRLLHQHAVGIPAETIQATIIDPEIRQWWDQYLIWQKQLPSKRFPELTLTTPIGETLLMAKYDLVTRLADSTILIVDWKTGKKPRRNSLAERLQTLVYPLVLARAGDWLNDDQPIPPEKIRMVYWFAKEPGTIDFEFSHELLERSEMRLKSVIEDITARFEFPLTHNHRHCRYCPYRSLCERGETAGDLRDLNPDEDEIGEEFEKAAALSFDLDDIEEISL